MNIELSFLAGADLKTRTRGLSWRGPEFKSRHLTMNRPSDAVNG